MEIPNVCSVKLAPKSSRKRQRIETRSDGSLGTSQQTSPPSLIYTVTPPSSPRLGYGHLMVSPSPRNCGRQSLENVRIPSIGSCQYSSVYIEHPKVNLCTPHTFEYYSSPLCIKKEKEDDNDLSYDGSSISISNHNNLLDSSSCDDLSYVTSFESASNSPEDNTTDVFDLGQFVNEDYINIEKCDDDTTHDSSTSSESAVEKFFRILEYNAYVASSNACAMNNLVNDLRCYTNTFEEAIPDCLHDRFSLTEFVEQPKYVSHFDSYQANSLNGNPLTPESSATTHMAFEQAAYITRVIEPMNLRISSIVSKLEPIDQSESSHSNEESERKWYAQMSPNIEGVYNYQRCTGNISRTQPCDYLDTSEVRHVTESNATDRLFNNARCSMNQDRSSQLHDLDSDDAFLKLLAPTKTQKLYKIPWTIVNNSSFIFIIALLLYSCFGDDFYDLARMAIPHMYKSSAKPTHTTNNQNDIINIPLSSCNVALLPEIPSNQPANTCKRSYLKHA